MDRYSRRVAGSLGLTYAEAHDMLKQAKELHNETHPCHAIEFRARIENAMKDDNVPRTVRKDHQRTLDWS